MLTPYMVIILLLRSFERKRILNLRRISISPWMHEAIYQSTILRKISQVTKVFGHFVPRSFRPNKIRYHFVLDFGVPRFLLGYKLSVSFVLSAIIVVSLTAPFSLVTPLITQRCVTKLKTAAREASIICMFTFIYVSLAVSVETL